MTITPKRILTYLLLLLGSALWAAGSQAAPARQALNWVIEAELPTADSVRSYDTLSVSQIELFGEGLYKLGQDNAIIPALAVGEPQISDDGTVYTIRLKDGLKWSNGDPLTARDFVFAWRRLLTPATAAQNASTFYNIKNAKAINSGEADPATLGIAALSDTELQVTLEYPNPYFLAALASSANLFPQNEAFVTAKGAAYGTSSENTLSNGPFVLTDWDGLGLTWRYVKNDNYHDKTAVKLDELTVQVVKETSTGINLYESGAVDAAKIDGDYIRHYRRDPAYLSVPTLRASNLELGISSSPVLQNENVRKALSLAIDRKELTGSILADGSLPLTSTIPQGIAANPTSGVDFAQEAGDLAPTDKAQAKALWQKAKQELGRNAITLELITSDFDEAKRTGEYLQSQLSSTLDGLTISLSSVPTKVRFDKMMSYKFDLALGGWTGEFDPVTYLNLFYSTYEHNHSRFKDAAFDTLIDKIKTTDATDPGQRWASLQQANKFVLDRALTIPLYQGSKNYLINPKLKGVITRSMGTPIDITRAYFED
ncbi:peptide ABC transporter substrate-binding protein [Brenneria corticis]|uniref:Peptide ABC transporter substrate-binding protein n=1 Tax=Brenneria corticis TaxID=2173106 RepID=A0A2U1U449_9GAMM|nr:peptide ABC transporter substrate-binding protein [Brenneria sp. CFCC 11842]PWC16435.1 peptide ABC transporter substrate-binding protein [Brenneria sp. CFCC 11842]